MGAKMNREGMTLAEWVRAARFPDYTPSARATSAEHVAWEEGEDPTEHAARRGASALGDAREAVDLPRGTR